MGLRCVLFSVLTLEHTHPQGSTAGEQVAGDVLSKHGAGANVLVVAEESTFANAATEALKAGGANVLGTVVGGPPDGHKALRSLQSSERQVKAIACSQTAQQWFQIDHDEKSGEVFGPRAYTASRFLGIQNLLNICSQVAIIAIIAIGMTMVIITGGIDLSVGSLIALASVVTALMIRDLFGGTGAGIGGLFVASLAGILVCMCVGLITGAFVTFIKIPPFIVTLSMMLIARGMASILTEGVSVEELPTAYNKLGRDADLLNIPNSVLLMLTLYIIAHLLMTRTSLGRYIYAVGGNAEAARLSGVPINQVLLFVYSMTGLLAGLGGIVMASMLNAGSAKYGDMYELYVIAAVVVGGTSLSGGEGKVFGTLIGALIIAVINNGMNLCKIQGFTQKVVLGLVILAAICIDRFRQSGKLNRLLESMGKKE